ncbi:MAG: HAD family phosphatase [Deltaproteobacteria bacterium]|nr:HAD family phosphatase [Deltaproteobacteria bacterium]
MSDSAPGPGLPDALLVDLGNVLVQLHIGRFVRRLQRRTGETGPPRDPLFAEQAYHRFARGELGPREFHAAVEQRLGLTWPYEDFVAAWTDVFEENGASVAAVRRMRSHRPVYLLSNTDTLHWEAIRRRWDWTGGFSGLHLSFEVGIEKPDPRFYRTFLERYGLRAAGCLFVDDTAENVEAARQTGLRAVRQVDDGTLARTVAELLDGR